MTVTVHGHQNILQGGNIGKNAFETTTTSLAGSISGFAVVDIALTHYAFFPMLHMTNSGSAEEVLVSGHSIDGASADAPRFSIWKNGFIVETYDIDYRNITA
jgi:uncharacterized protein YcsI (UPF0317 family)